MCWSSFESFDKFCLALKNQKLNVFIHIKMKIENSYAMAKIKPII